MKLDTVAIKKAHIGANNAPQFFADFRLGTLPSGFTHTRSSTATYYDNAGILQTASTNTPRFAYDPTSLLPLGLQIETASTNLVSRSADFTHSDWARGVGATVSADQATAPTGATEADTCTFTSANTAQIRRTTGIGVTASTNYCFSIFAKRVSGADWLRITYYENTNSDNSLDAWCNLSTGAMGAATAGGDGVIAGSGCVVLPNDWVMLWMAGKIGTGTVGNFQFHMASSSGSKSRAVGSMYAWGADFKAGSYPTSHIPTATSTASRSADVLKGSIAEVLLSTVTLQDSTIFIEGRSSTIASGAIRTLYNLDDGTANNSVQGYFTAAAALGGLSVTTSGVSQASVTAAVRGENFNYGSVLKQDDFAVCTDGGTMATDTSGTFPSGLSIFRIGCNASDTAQLDGTIKKIALYNGRKTDNLVQLRTGEPLINVASPVITGTPQFYSQLAASTGSWNVPSAYTYQWKADGAVITGATSAQYRLTQSEIGKTITCETTGTNAYGAVVAATAATATVDTKTMNFGSSSDEIWIDSEIPFQYGKIRFGFQAGTTNASQWMISDRLSTTTNYFQVLYNTSSSIINLRINNGSNQELNGTVSANTLYHSVEISVQSTGMTLTIDGVSVGTSAYTGGFITGTGKTMVIGGRGIGNTIECFNGEISHIEFVNTSDTVVRSEPELDFVSRQVLPDGASGSTAGKGFTCTGLTKDTSNNTFWVSNYGEPYFGANSFTPSLVNVSADFTTFNSQIVLNSIIGNTNNNVQGVYYHAADDTLYFVEGTYNKIHHINKSGTLLGTITHAFDASGLTYDPVNSALLVSDGTQIQRINSSTGAVLATFNPNMGIIDHLHWDNDREMVWVAIGGNNNRFNDRVVLYDLDTSSVVRTWMVQVTGALEGIYVDTNDMYVCSDEYLHVVADINAIHHYTITGDHAL